MVGSALLFTATGLDDTATLQETYASLPSFYFSENIVNESWAFCNTILSYTAHQIVNLPLLSLHSSGLSVIAFYNYNTATGLFHAYRNIGAVSRTSMRLMKPNEEGAISRFVYVPSATTSQSAGN